MSLKLIFVVAVFACHLVSVGHVATQKTEVADDEGDLNPQPLPPIVEDEFGQGLFS